MNTTEPISVVIIDDDKASVDVLRETLATYPHVNLLATASNLKEGRELLNELNPDLVFLDIEFPDGNGLDIFDEDNPLPSTRFIFYTLYSKYYHEAFRLRAYDYLLKPFDPQEVDLILERYRLEGSLPGITAPEVRRNLPHRPDVLPISITTLTGERLILPPNAILFFKYDSSRKIWEAVLTTLERHILKRHTTAELILSYGPDFVRTHKAYIININYLGVLTGNECRLLPPFNEITEIKISKNYKRPLLDRFYDL